MKYSLRDKPETITLPVHHGVQPSGKPPVRIFLGSEPAQYRAERVFLWSIEKHRDPARVYEISLLKRLAGFDDRRWLTGFTNYRFAVAHFAGGRGRAIYNDTDQVYCADPALLFDLELNDHGYLAISPRDTSVMLIDCERMIKIWSFERAPRWRKNRLIDAALTTSTTYGALDGIWNARDEEYEAGKSQCVHFTTIHKQPWCPFPDRFIYQDNAIGEVFFALEAEANAAGYHGFSRTRPSADFARKREQVALKRPEGAALEPFVVETLDDLLSRAEATSMLEIQTGFGHLETTESPTRHALLAQKLGLYSALSSDNAQASFDAVVCAADLESLPLDDIPWVIDEIVRHAKKLVLVAVRDTGSARELRAHRGTVLSASWWSKLLEMAVARHPHLHWSLIVTTATNFTASDATVRHGGRFIGANPPRVWLLEDHKPGHTTQSLGLINALAWPYQRIKLEFGPLANRPNFLRGPTLRGLTEASASQLAPPWPDLVVASGARAAPVAEWVRKQAQGKTRSVVLGRKGAHLGNDFDLAVAPAYIGLYPDSRRMETTVPLTRVHRDELDAAAARWTPILGAAPSPRIALLIGGDDSVHAFDVAQARRMGGEVGSLAREAGGSVFVTTSRRTDTDAARALVDALGNVTVHSYHWSAAHSKEENPYFGYLALADILIVSGESASMLAEAAATGKPVVIYPIAKRGKDIHRVKFLFGQRISRWVLARAFARPLNRRGFERPQAGIEKFCARLAANGWVRPYGDITKLHEALIERGQAKYFDGVLPVPPDEALNEAERVAERVRAILGAVAPGE